MNMAEGLKSIINSISSVKCHILENIQEKQKNNYLIGCAEMRSFPVAPGG